MSNNLNTHLYTEFVKCYNTENSGEYKGVTYYNATTQFVDYEYASKHEIECVRKLYHLYDRIKYNRGSTNIDMKEFAIFMRFLEIDDTSQFCFDAIAAIKSSYADILSRLNNVDIPHLGVFLRALIRGDINYEHLIELGISIIQEDSVSKLNSADVIHRYRNIEELDMHITKLLFSRLFSLSQKRFKDICYHIEYYSEFLRSIKVCINHTSIQFRFPSEVLLLQKLCMLSSESQFDEFVKSLYVAMDKKDVFYLLQTTSKTITAWEIEIVKNGTVFQCLPFQEAFTLLCHLYTDKLFPHPNTMLKMTAEGFISHMKRKFEDIYHNNRVFDITTVFIDAVLQLMQSRMYSEENINTKQFFLRSASKMREYIKPVKYDNMLNFCIDYYDKLTS